MERCDHLNTKMEGQFQQVEEEHLSRIPYPDRLLIQLRSKLCSGTKQLGSPSIELCW